MPSREVVRHLVHYEYTAGLTTKDIITRINRAYGEGTVTKCVVERLVEIFQQNELEKKGNTSALRRNYGPLNAEDYEALMERMETSTTLDSGVLCREFGCPRMEICRILKAKGFIFKLHRWVKDGEFKKKKQTAPKKPRDKSEIEKSKEEKRQKALARAAQLQPYVYDAQLNAIQSLVNAELASRNVEAVANQGNGNGTFETLDGTIGTVGTLGEIIGAPVDGTSGTVGTLSETVGTVAGTIGTAGSSSEEITHIEGPAESFPLANGRAVSTTDSGQPLVYVGNLMPHAVISVQIGRNQLEITDQLVKRAVNK